MIRLADTPMLEMYLIRKHDIDVLYWCVRRLVLHELQSANTHYISMQSAHTAHIEKNNCEQYYKWDATGKYMGRL